MKKGLIIGAVILGILWAGGVTFFVFGQIYWNRYMVSQVDSTIDAVNQMNETLYTPASADNSVVR